MLVVIPCGGLGNRLMALASAAVLAEHVGCPLQVVWRGQPHLKLSYYPISALFEGIDSVPLVEAELPRGFNHHHHVQGPVPEVERRLRAGEIVFLHSYCFIKPAGMGPDDFLENVYRQFERFEPRSEVLARVPELPVGTIGIQTRRGDNWRATRYSPISLFFRVMDRHCNGRAGAHFFLASDSVRIKYEMKKRYGQRIITLEGSAASPAEGAQTALVDILALSRTERIYASVMSSFGFVAHLMSRCPHFSVSVSNVPVDWHDSPADKLHDRLIDWNQDAGVWQRRTVPDASLVMQLQAALILCWTRFVCSRAFQHWPWHRMRPLDD